MGQIILPNCKLWIGGYDLSATMNGLALLYGPDALDNTTFGMTAKSRKAGLPLITANHQGFWEQEPDEAFSDIGTPDIPMTAAPEGDEGDPAYSFLSQNSEYSLGGNVGELLKFTVKAESVGQQLIRGKILVNGTKTETGNGTAFNLGEIVAGKYLYGVLHVISAATSVADTLDVIIESDSQEDFLGSAETQITFATVLGNGGRTYEWATPIAGPITDTWWRASWTIVLDDDPSFSFVVFMAIQ